MFSHKASSMAKMPLTYIITLQLQNLSDIWGIYNREVNRNQDKNIYCCKMKANKHLEMKYGPMGILLNDLHLNSGRS